MGRVEDVEFRGTSRFAVERRLGAGGMGIVYEAVDRESHARVALKLLRTPTPEAVGRLRRELGALRGLRHPNLVGLGELVEDAGACFFTMELVRGTDLLAYLRPRDGRTLDESRLRDALAQLTRGLLALHGAGRVHCDVKPSNVIVDGVGRLVLLDFGLTAELGQGGWPDRGVVGTAVYMAPEQAVGAQAGPEADWYSVGVVLYEALVGRPPFVGADRAVLEDKQRHAPARPAEVAAGVPADLDELCMELLAFEPGSRPSGRGILRRLGVGTGEADTATSSLLTQAPFVDRGDELAALGEALHDVRAGRPAVVELRGESGIGKRSLLRAFGERVVADPRAVFLAGRCDPGGATPHGPFDGVIASLARQLEHLTTAETTAVVPEDASLLLQMFPVLRRVDAMIDAPPVDILDRQERRARALTALRDLMVRLARIRTVVVAIEDLQWADDDALTILEELTRPPEAPAILVVITEVASGLRAPLGLRLELGPLPAAAAEELARALLVRVGGPPDRAAALARRVGGRPLALEVAVSAAALAGDGAPLHDVDAILAARIARLDPPARRALELVAVAGGPVGRDVIAHAAGAEPSALSRQLAMLRVVDLVRLERGRDGDVVAPYHAAVRDAVLAGLPPGERESRHRELARALDTSGRADPAAQLAHLIGAGEREAAAACAARAADAAMRVLAFDQASRMLGVALEHPPADATVTRALRVALGDALAATGRGVEAAQAYLAAVPGAPAAEALDLQRRAAQRLVVCGQLEAGIATMSAFLEPEGMSYPRTPLRALLSIAASRARLKLRGLSFAQRDQTDLSAKELVRLDACLNASMCLAIVDPVRSQAFSLRGLLLALRAGEPVRLAKALAMEGARRVASSGRLEDSEEIFATAEQLALGVTAPDALAYVRGARGQSAQLSGHFRAARDLCLESEVVWRERCNDASFEITTMRLWSCRALYYMGEYAALARELPATLAECARRSDHHTATTLRASLSPLVHLAAGDAAAARAEIATVARDASPASFHVQHYHALVSEASTSLYEGVPRIGHDAVVTTWPRVQRALLLRVPFIRIVLVDLRARCALAIATAAAATSERRDFAAQAARDARLLEKLQIPWAAALAALIRAQVAELAGDRDATALRWSTAVGLLEGLHMGVHAAVARRRLGRVIGGDDGAALVALAEARLAAERIVAPARLCHLLAPEAAA